MIAIPLRDQGQQSFLPWVVVALITLNVASFLFLEPPSLQRGAADLGRQTSTEQRDAIEHFSAWGAVPCEIAQLKSRSDGARCTKDGDYPIIDRKPVVLSVITALFEHGSIAHLAYNMLFLWIFGAAVENRLGSGAFSTVFGLGGVASTLIFVALNLHSAAPLIGASGAISAVLGAFLILTPRRKLLALLLPIPFIEVTLPAWVLILPWLIGQFFLPTDTAVAWQAHIGGIAAGALMGLLARYLIPSPGQFRRFRGHTKAERPDPSSWSIPDGPPLEG